MSYNASNIQVLKGMEAVQQRMGMFLGSPNDGSALHHCLYEVWDNSVDEHLAGHCSNISVVLHPDGSASVTDDGRGIPVDVHPKTKQPTVTTVLTEIFAGGKFDNSAYQNSAGLHGVGVSAVNAVSEWLVVVVHRDGKTHQQTFNKGLPVEPLKVTGKCGKQTGTSIRFKPNLELFTEVLDFDVDIVLTRLEELAFLNAGLNIDLTDMRTDKTWNFHYKGGVTEYVKNICKKRRPIHQSVIHFVDKPKKATQVEIALQWTDSAIEDVRTYTNNVFNKDGGTHLTGFRNGLTRVLTKAAQDSGALKGLTLTGDDVREGLVAIVNLRIPNPSFSSQTKEKLVTPEARTLVEQSLVEALTDYLQSHPSIAKNITDRAVLAAKAREAARKARELVQRQSVLDVMSLPGKLADCQSKDPSECELLIVEGDSAGGSTKSGRDRRTQAVLPLRGKVLNTENKDAEAILENQELGTVYTALGCGLETAGNFDIGKLRYHKVILCTDADVDGAHIRTLLLTFFYRHMPRLILEGHVYIAVPPLYRLKTDRMEKYFIDDAAFKEYMSTLRDDERKKSRITRYKGLGEMNPETLWHTTLDPAVRSLKRVSVDDAVVAERYFEILMGDLPEVRREFIEDNSAYVGEIDY